jgi:acyl transferase domain-containing protein/NADPH:quinone reductase-like Zn-dependent oxidoreductase/SAM-dependent methyltransferase
MTNHAAWEKSIWSSKSATNGFAPLPRAKRDVEPSPNEIVSSEDLLRQHCTIGRLGQTRQKSSVPTGCPGTGLTNGCSNLGEPHVADGSLGHRVVGLKHVEDTVPGINEQRTTRQATPVGSVTNGIATVRSNKEMIGNDHSQMNGVGSVKDKSCTETWDLKTQFMHHSDAEMEPLAIVGMAFQFPSGAITEESLWDILINQRCTSTKFPADRMNIDAFYNQDITKHNAIHTRKGHFLDHDIRRFDAKHFNIPPLEAGAMDPNQRGLIETTYHALENAGIASSSIAESNTSVHVGFFSSDHTTFNLRDPLRIPKYYATGSSASILSNRISWLFNLRGPSMTIDTACSSSLVAMDLACQGLWAGQTDMAIVAAANLILSPELNIALSNMNFLSPDGKCYSFDHRASGYARGEGFSAVVIKPLSKALAAGDNIRALVRSVLSNQDGHTIGGITQPSRAMQANLIRRTYAKAGLDMRETRFFEAHGTGTPLGDPTEARAIGESFREHRSDCAPLYVGAVKSNLGHLEGASGLAGIVKAVMALEKGIIPPNANFESLNPAIDDEFLRLRFPLHPTAWPAGNVRRASVNSFGFGGSNVHVVLDDAASYLRSRNLHGNHFGELRCGHVAKSDQDGPRIHSVEINGDGKHSSEDALVSGTNSNNFIQSSCANDGLQLHSKTTWTPKLVILSSTSVTGLTAQTNAHEKFLQGAERTSLHDYVYTLALRRNLLSWRSYAVLHSPDQVKDLSSFMSRPVQSLGADPKLGFVFTGQGAQWFGMGRELLCEPAFGDSILRSQQCLNDLGCEWSLAERLTDHAYEPSVGEPQFSQTMTTCLQLALCDLVISVGMQPAVVVGHSSGEIAAAYASGHLSRASAVAVSYYRGLLCSSLEKTCPTSHSMAAIGLSRNAMMEEIMSLASQTKFDAASVTISCNNSPRNVTISGPTAQLDLVVQSLTRKNVFTRKLRVNLGYHSHQMDQISSLYQSLLVHLAPGDAVAWKRPSMVSTVTGLPVERSAVCNAEYWVRNLTSPVDFNNAIQFCHSDQDASENHNRLSLGMGMVMCTHGWLEIGPHAALKGPIREIMESMSQKGVVYASALIRNESSCSSLLKAAGELLCHSLIKATKQLVTLGLSRKQRQSLRPLHDLPKYQFDHSQLYWEEPSLSQNFRFRKHGNHDLLGTMITEPNSLESEWKFIIKEDEMPWVRDHKVAGALLYPAAGMMVMAIEAVKQLTEDDPPNAFVFTDVSFPAPIVITLAPEGVEVRLHVSSSAKGTKRETDYSFRIFLLRSDGSHEITCTGKLHADYQVEASSFTYSKEEAEKAREVRSKFEAVTAACKPVLSSAEWYEKIGMETSLEYGAAFQVLDDIQCNKHGKAVAELVPRCEDSTTPHSVHPTTLDGAFQVGLFAVSGMRKAAQAVPTFVSHVWIALEGFGRLKQPVQKAFVEVMDVSTHGGTFDVTAVNAHNASRVLEIHGLEVTTVASNTEVLTTLQDAQYLCSHMEWKVDLDMLDSNAVHEFCETARVPSGEPSEYFRRMDQIVLQYGARALSEIDVAGQAITPGLTSYAAWLRSHIDAHPDLRLIDEKDMDVLCDSVRHTVRGQLHILIGEHLTRFLVGQADPLEVIFCDESRISEFYRELMEETTGIDPFSRYLDALVHKDPALNFLEVGAGTGGSTSVIMRTIGDLKFAPRFEEYMYTDISPTFFERARIRFPENTRFKFQTLDIEDEVEAQGFEPKYDVVIADNILHATIDLPKALRNVRKLLRPGGKLILKELVTPKRMLTGFAFGLVPGWWLADRAEEQLSPLLTVTEWHKILSCNGFAGVDFSLPDHLTTETHIWSIMIATAEPSYDIAMPLTIQELVYTHVVLDTSSRAQVELADSLAGVLGLDKELPRLDLATAGELCYIEPDTHLFLFLNALDGSFLRKIQQTDFGNLQKLLGGAKGVIWTKGGGGAVCSDSPDHGMSDGLCRVARRENNNVLVSVALEKNDNSLSTALAKVVKKMQESISFGIADSELEYMVMGGKLCIGRLRRAIAIDEHLFKRTLSPVLLQEIGDRELQMEIRARGLLDTIQFQEDNTFQRGPGGGDVDVDVKAFGVNYKDCLTLLGKMNSDMLGSECSGVIRAVGPDVKNFSIGDRVLVGALNVFRTRVRVPAGAVVRIPDTMEFYQAAAIFTNFCTAYYSLHEVAHLRQGESVLIHAAAGATGQALVQVAQSLGAEVYATVGSSSKKDLLTSTYGILEERIFHSRNVSFRDGIKRVTGGRGVDVVVDSQQGRLHEAFWECVAVSGRFIDIGLKDAFMKQNLPMHIFTKNVSYSGINLAVLISHDFVQLQRVLTSVLTLFEKGNLQPITPIHRYPLQNIEEALRFLQNGKSTGKIVIDIDRTASVPVSMQLFTVIATC